MANKKSRKESRLPGQVSFFERHNLVAEVWAWHVEEGLGGKRIHNRLKDMGTYPDLPSYSAVEQWLTRLRKRKKKQTQDIVEKHLLKTLPKDLDTLDEMLKVSIGNARMSAADRGEKIGAHPRFIEEFKSRWGQLLVDAYAEESTKPKALSALVSSIVSQVAQWATDDLQYYRHLREERMIAVRIINLKIQYEAYFKGAGGGNINIFGMGQGPGQLPPDQAAEEQGRVEGAQANVKKHVFQGPKGETNLTLVEAKQ